MAEIRPRSDKTGLSSWEHSSDNGGSDRRVTWPIMVLPTKAKSRQLGKRVRTRRA